MNHTPGPWVFHEDEGRAPDGYLPVYGPMKANGHTFFPRILSVGALGGPAHYDYKQHDMDNARLVAAAPDLFAAAEEAIRYVSDDQMVVEATTPFMVLLVAAYKKARGE